MPTAAHEVIHNPDSPMIFAGEFRHAIDPKNRVTIPARWRRGEADEFFLVLSQSKTHLVAFPPAEFENVGREIQEKSQFSEAQRRVFLRQFYAKAQHCVMDRQGRLVLPPEFSKAAGIKGETVLVGNMTRFEFWNAAAWDAECQETSPTYDAMAASFGL